MLLLSRPQRLPPAEAGGPPGHLRYNVGMLEVHEWMRIGAVVLGVGGVLLAVAAVGRLLGARRRRSLLMRQRDAQTLRGLTWQQFEQLCREVFERQGFRVTLTGTSAADGGGAGVAGSGAGDGGVDLVLERDDWLGPRRFLVQCKHWKAERVGVATVRELQGVVDVERATGGVCVTSGRYTAEAKTFAERAGVHLINGAELAKQVQAAQGVKAP